MDHQEKVETVAEALWANHHPKDQRWDSYCRDHPDMAKIYRDNALVAIETMEKCS